MATVREIISRSMRKIGLIGPREEAEAEEMAEALDAFNAMFHGWKLRGVDLTHTDVTLNDTFPLGQEYEEGTVFLLAARISPDYEIPARFDADDWFRTFQAAYFATNEATIAPGLLNMPSQRTWFS